MRGKAVQVRRVRRSRDHFFYGGRNFAPRISQRVPKTRVNVANFWALIENPIEADRRRVEVRHPVARVLCPAKSDNSEVRAAGADGVNIPEVLGQIDPVEICETELLSNNGFCFGLRPVSGIGKLGE